MVFTGEELLEFALASIRNNIDFISVTYQTTSHFGNPAAPNLFPLLRQLKGSNLIDEIVHYESDLSLHPKVNELKLRNMGLDLSRQVGCTHHISADVDEFYDPLQLEYIKNNMGDNDLSIVGYDNYYKDPTFLVTPSQNLVISFIHKISSEYNMDIQFPFRIEKTRKLTNHNKIKVFSREEFTMHHMSYVRKDIAKKFNNSGNSKCYKMKEFIENFNKYKVGDRVCLLPDFINRKTILVENKFGIKI